MLRVCGLTRKNNKSITESVHFLSFDGNMQEWTDAPRDNHDPFSSTIVLNVIKVPIAAN